MGWAHSANHFPSQFENVERIEQQDIIDSFIWFGPTSEPYHSGCDPECIPLQQWLQDYVEMAEKEECTFAMAIHHDTAAFSIIFSKSNCSFFSFF